MSVRLGCGRLSGDSFCEGVATWERSKDGWRSECSKCGATSRAAVLEQLELEAIVEAREAVDGAP